MAYSLTFKAEIILIIVIFCLIGTINAQPDIPERNRRDFIKYVLSDSSNEPDALVFKIETIDYDGYVIDFGYFYETLIQQYFKDSLSFSKDSLFSMLVERRPIEVHCHMNEFRNSVILPPQKHPFYKFILKSPNKLIKKFFIQEMSTGRYYMANTLNRADQLALIVVLFEHQIPVYENGWGIWIDTNTEHSSDSK